MSAPGPVRAAEDSRSNWETPDELFNQLDKQFGFTLDAAADESNTKCANFLTGPCVDAGCGCGLCESWAGFTVWCNPPYGKNIWDWVLKFESETKDAVTIVALLPANTDTKWFRRVWQTATEIWFLRGRVQFVGTTSSNPGGSMVAIYRRLPGTLMGPYPVVRLWDWRNQ